MTTTGASRPSGAARRAESGDESPSRRHVRSAAQQAQTAGLRDTHRLVAEPRLAAGALETARAAVYEAVADTVSGAMRGTGHRQLSRRLGRDVTGILTRVYAEHDCKVSTLADIALATGCTLVIELRRND
jgi:hypothetical protein